MNRPWHGHETWRCYLVFLDNCKLNFKKTRKYLKMYYYFMAYMHMDVKSTVHRLKYGSDKLNIWIHAVIIKKYWNICFRPCRCTYLKLVLLHARAGLLFEMISKMSSVSSKRSARHAKFHVISSRPTGMAKPKASRLWPGFRLNQIFYVVYTVLYLGHAHAARALQGARKPEVHRHCSALECYTFTLQFNGWIFL